MCKRQNDFFTFLLWHLAAHLDVMVVWCVKQTSDGNSWLFHVKFDVSFCYLMREFSDEYPKLSALKGDTHLKNHIFACSSEECFSIPCFPLTLEWVGISLFFADSKECSLQRAVNTERSGSAPNIMWAKYLTSNKHIFWNLYFSCSFFTLIFKASFWFVSSPYCTSARPK